MQKKTKTIGFRVTEVEYQTLTLFAEQEGYRNLSEWMHQLVRDEITDRLGDDEQQP
jgi:hypothetical protein